MLAHMHSGKIQAHELTLREIAFQIKSIITKLANKHYNIRAVDLIVVGLVLFSDNSFTTQAIWLAVSMFHMHTKIPKMVINYGIERIIAVCGFYGQHLNLNQLTTI